MRRDVSLIVGNGFSLGFNKFHNFEKLGDTQNPTKWPIYELRSGNHILDSFPYLKKFLSESQHNNDFDLFKDCVDIYKSTEYLIKYFDGADEITLTEQFKRDIIPHECRHFLCLAFADYSRQTKSILKKEWPWYRWLLENRSRISGICSFNYDLILEQCLHKMCASYNNGTVSRPAGLITLYKPHGSCNYELDDFRFNGLKYPITWFIDNVQLPVKELSEYDMLKARISPLCVLPNQENIYSHYETMQSQNFKFIQCLNSCKYFVIIGHSYADVDRPEIDSTLSELQPGTTVIVANPFPSSDLIKAIEERDLKVNIWQSLAGPVDEKGNLLQF